MGKNVAYGPWPSLIGALVSAQHGVKFQRCGYEQCQPQPMLGGCFINTTFRLRQIDELTVRKQFKKICHTPGDKITGFRAMRDSEAIFIRSSYLRRCAAMF